MAKIKLWYVYESPSMGLTGDTVSLDETSILSVPAPFVLTMIAQAKPQHAKVLAWFPYKDTFDLWCKHKATMRMDDFKKWRVQVFNTIYNVGCTEVTADDLKGLPAPVTNHPRRVRVPSLPVEVWNDAPIDANKAMDAMRVLCGGQAKGE